jgi:hypothetical protein
MHSEALTFQKKLPQALSLCVARAAGDGHTFLTGSVAVDGAWRGSVSCPCKLPGQCVLH